MPKGVANNGLWRGQESVASWLARQEPTPCECGCGQLIMPRPAHRAKGIPRFVHGHHARGGNHHRELHPNWHDDRCAVRGGRHGAYFTPSIKAQIWAGDGGRCRTCGALGSLCFDHVVPVREGGDGAADNGQVLCAACHQTKTTAEGRRRAEERRDGHHRNAA